MKMPSKKSQINTVPIVVLSLIIFLAMSVMQKNVSMTPSFRHGTLFLHINLHFCVLFLAKLPAIFHSTDIITIIPIVITDIKINSTSLRFSHNHKNGTQTVDSHIYAVLDNGHEIGISGGSGTVNGDILNNVYRWTIPIDPAELSAIKIGNTTISIP